MFTHKQIWDAFDAVAASQGLTASGLARKAGLDATSFNRSKRVSKEGRERWPSTETLSKILGITGMDLKDFASLMGHADTDPEGSAAYVPAREDSRERADA